MQYWEEEKEVHFSPPAVALCISCTGGEPQMPFSPLGGTTQQSNDALPSELQFMPVAKGKTEHRRVGKESHSHGNAVPEAKVACEASGEQLIDCCAERTG